MPDDSVGAQLSAPGRDKSRPHNGQRPRVLLIYASFGSGHRRAAQALHEVLQERGIPSETQDLVPFLPGPLKSLYPWGYDLLINRWRTGWKILYNRLDRPSKPYTPAKSRLQRWQFRR